MYVCDERKARQCVCLYKGLTHFQFPQHQSSGAHGGLGPLPRSHPATNSTELLRVGLVAGAHTVLGQLLCVSLPRHTHYRSLQMASNNTGLHTRHHVHMVNPQDAIHLQNFRLRETRASIPHPTPHTTRTQEYIMLLELFQWSPLMCPSTQSCDSRQEGIGPLL